MDAGGNIYRLDEEPIMPEEVQSEDVERLRSFLGKRAERDQERRERFLQKYGVQVWDSRSKGPYRKDSTMGIENVENQTGDDAAPEQPLQQNDPGDEQQAPQEGQNEPQVVVDPAAGDPSIQRGTPAPDTTPPGGDNPAPGSAPSDGDYPAAGEAPAPDMTPAGEENPPVREDLQKAPGFESDDANANPSNPAEGSQEQG